MNKLQEKGAAHILLIILLIIGLITAVYLVNNKKTNIKSKASGSIISAFEIKDANGNALQDGDTVTVIKDLKVKGSSLVVKVGTKVKNIRLVDGDHDIDCKVDGIGPMKLKSEFVKKSN